MNIIQEFSGRDAGLLIQFIKYAIGGGIATVAHIVLFHILAWKVLPALQNKDWAVVMFKLQVPPCDDVTRSRNSMIDNFMAFFVSNMVAYLINIWWVFAPGRHSVIVEIALFYAVSGISVLLGTSLMGFLIRRYGMRTTYAFLANIVSAVLINYAARKYFIFNG